PSCEVAYMNMRTANGIGTSYNVHNPQRFSTVHPHISDTRSNTRTSQHQHITTPVISLSPVQPRHTPSPTSCACSTHSGWQQTELLSQSTQSSSASYYEPGRTLQEHPKATCTSPRYPTLQY